MAWQNNKKIVGLWAYGPANRWAWVNIQNLGWRLLWNDHDSQVVALMALAISAKAKDRYVNFFEDGNKIKEMYVC